jgi:hypothetical protein
MMQWLHKITEGLHNLGGWTKSVASESDGSGSSSRTALLLMTTTICGLLIAFYHAHKFLPDHDTLYGLAALLACLTGAYGINKFTDK